MPIWTPTTEWQGRAAYVIGGGASLKGFDWSRLEGRCTIGCNDAFRLGSSVVQICILGDASWFHRVKFELEKFSGRVVSCAPSLYRLNVPWLLQVQRQRDGLGSGNKLAWNFSTGAAAANLAVTLGANRIFLLGFDMRRDGGGLTHWHGYRAKPTDDMVFVRFLKGFASLASALGKERPEVQVRNVTDGSSRLTVFPAASVEEALAS